MSDESVQADFDEYLAKVAAKYDVGAGDYPEAPTKDSQLLFMRDVVEEVDALKQAKTSNLDEREAGFTPISVSDLLRISHFARSEGLGVVGDYLDRRALIVGGVSLGRKAKLLDTLFTVRRETRTLGTPRTTVKRNLFGQETKIVEGDGN